MMPPRFVQEPFINTPRISSDGFVFVVCQHGTEGPLKARWATSDHPFRLAFSRPGLLTFKVTPLAAPSHEPGKEAPPSPAPPHDWMVRLSGCALGQVRSPQHTASTAEQLVAQAIDLAGNQWQAVHVFERDRHLPGMFGFEPGPTPLCHEIGQRFAAGLSAAAGTPPPPVNLPAEFGHRVLDVVLIEPHHWLIGYHVVERPHERWPGGAYAAPAPDPMVSRAYLKMAEAVAWSGLPLAPGDCIAEIGSAPGGACQRLLDLGLRVTAIDPAEMDPLLLDHPRLEHWRGKSSAIRRRMYAKFRWLAADANVAPNYTLDAVEDIVTYKTSRIEGLILTLKLSSYDLSAHMDTYLDRVRSWGFQRVEVRQLAANRRECCVVAQRND